MLAYDGCVFEFPCMFLIIICLEKHVEKLRDLSIEMINKLMNMVGDIDTLYHRIQQEDDSDTKQVID